MTSAIPSQIIDFSIVIVETPLKEQSGRECSEILALMIMPINTRPLYFGPEWYLINGTCPVSLSHNTLVVVVVVLLLIFTAMLCLYSFFNTGWSRALANPPRLHDRAMLPPHSSPPVSGERTDTNARYGERRCLKIALPEAPNHD